MDTEKKAGGSKTSLKVGIWGGHGGTGWDDGSFHGVREITLIYDRCIDSIRVEYDKNGKSVLAEKHGGNGGNYTAHIKLQYPEEFLTAISGYYSPLVSGGPPVIRSLTFKSNKKTFGPYGVEEGTPFIYQIEEGRIVGFRGRSGWYLDAISFHLSGNRMVSSFCDMVHQKIKKLGTITTKSLGYHNNGQHASHGKAT